MGALYHPPGAGGANCLIKKERNMDKPKMILLGSAIIMEIAAVILIAKTLSTDSSPTVGLMFLIIGLVFLVIGVTRKQKDVKPENSPKN